MLVFGYGSLIWKADFPFERRIVGYVVGYKRRFYQHSTDHRGTPEKPGRVVTLIPSEDPQSQVWGVAYLISQEKYEEVISHLDYREKGGYVRKRVLFYPKDEPDRPFEIIIYVGTAENFQYAGEADVESIAKQVVSSVGPSGTNVEYVLNLAKAMREIAPGIDDDHLFDIEAEIFKLTRNAGR